MQIPIQQEGRPGKPSRLARVMWLAALFAITSSHAAPKLERDGGKVVLGDGRGGLAFRIAWFEREDPEQPSRITTYRFPVACDYDSQEIHSVNPVREGGELREDEQGNVILTYPEPIDIQTETPLCLGTVNSVDLYSRAALEVDPLRVGKKKVPKDILERFTADDEILSLENPQIVDLAERLAADAKNSFEVVLRTWRYVHETLSYGRVERPNTAAQVLEWRKGQCGEYGKITIALLRANGIPARGVWCLRAGNTGPSADDHAWAEAWIGGVGWFPIRPQEEPPTGKLFALGYHSYQIVCRPQGGMDELRDVQWENARCPTGYRGVGFFADVPEGKRKTTIELFQDIANDADGRRAKRLLGRADKAHRAAQPMMYWLLVASPDAKIGASAAEKLVSICSQEDRRLGLERFVKASPALIRTRIAEARE